MDSNTEEYIKRVDPEIHEALGETENFEEIVDAIRADADEIEGKLEAGGTEYLAYMLSMQNKALNEVIEQLEELRPSIRFITSVLLGNTEEETE